MNMPDNPTIQTDSDPWDQNDQENMENWPTAYSGSYVDTGAPTVVGGGGGEAPNAPTVVGNQGGGAPMYPPPSPGAQPYPPAMPPQPPNYGGQPQPNYGVPQPYGPPPQVPNPGGRGAATVMMDVMRDLIPLAWLAVVEGPGAARGSVYTLGRETLLGRAAGEIILGMDPAISTQHIKVRLEVSEADPEQQVFVLYDMASANVYLWGDYESCKQDSAERVYRYELKDGDFLLVGQTILVFKKV